MKALDRQVDQTERKINSFGITNAVAAKEVDNLGDQVDATGHDMDGLTAQTEAAKTSVGGLGEKSNKTSAELTLLDRRIAAVKRSLAAMNLEFAATGNDALGGRINKQRSLLQQLEKLRSEVDKLNKNEVSSFLDNLVIEGGLAGNKASRGFISKFGQGILDFGAEGIKPLHVLIAIAVGIILAALPAIGAAVGGAIIGGVGAGGIIGGVVAAAHDPRVKSAWQQFAMDAKAQFLSIGDAFVEPVRAALAILDRDVQSLDLKDTFALAAPYVETLAAGLGAMARNFMPGFREALSRAAPYVVALAKGLAGTGKALGDMIAEISESKGTLEGLKFLFSAIIGTITATGNIIRWLGDRFHDLNQFVSKTLGIGADVLDFLGKWSSLPAGMGDDLRQLKANIDTLDDSSGDLVMSNLKLGDSFRDNTDAVEEYQKTIMDTEHAFDDYINKVTGVLDANIAVKQGWADLDDQLKRGKGNWDDNTQAGRDNLRMISDQIKAIQTKRDQDINASNGSQQAIDAVNRKYNEEIDKLIGIEKQAGATKAQLDLLNGLHIQIVEDVIIRNQLTKAAAVDKNLALHGFASGGVTPANEVFKVGEHGTEYLFSDRSHYVATQQQMWNGAGSGSQQIQIVISPAPGSDRTVMSAITNSLRFDVRTASGGSVQTHFGPRR